MATISPKTLTEELSLREKRQNYDGIDAAISLAQNETNAARNATGGNAVGELVGGLESLIEVANNLVENVESTAKTVIGKVKPDGHGLEASLKPLLTDAEIASHQAVLKNAAVDISAIFGPAITSLTASSKMNHKIITDLSPEAATTALKTAAGLKSNLPLKDLQKAFVPEKFKDIVETAVNKIEIK
jgi:hypothetical protein